MKNNFSTGLASWPILYMFCILIMTPFTLPGQSQSTSTAELSPTKKKKVKKSSIFSFLSNEEIANITIKANFQRLIELKNKLHEEEAVLTFKNKQGQEVSYNIKLEIRGKTRRRVCSFPPLKLDFSKKELKENELKNSFRKLKLVTHCNGESLDEQNVLKEYLAYKLFNKITEASFRVKLVRVTYQDSGGNVEDIERFAFLIENDDELANRMGGKIVERFSVRPNDLHGDNFVTLAMFQYMVGNTDWRIPNLHNVKVAKLDKDSTKLIAIPYDFDYSGFVNAYYAKPNPDLQQESVKKRVCLGNYQDETHFSTSTGPFREAKAEMMQLCQEMDFFDKKSRKHTSKYLKSFFKEVENKSKVKKIIQKQNTTYAGFD